MGHDELLSAETVDRAFSTLNLRGRFQLINVNRPWILDVAHNPAAAAVLAASLSPIARDSRVIAVVGMLADKDITGVITPFSESIDSWVAVPLHGSRTVPAAALAQQIANCTGKPCRIAQSIEEALETADTLSEPDTTVLVTGSFYVVGPALEWLDARRQ